MPSPLDTAKRRLVSLLRELGQRYGVAVSVTRESQPEEVRRAFRSVARKVHPDKAGGNAEDFQNMSAANDAWTDLLKTRKRPGRQQQAQRTGADPTRETKGASAVAVVLPCVEKKEKAFRFQSRAVLLTYQGFDAVEVEALKAWSRFLAFVHSNKRAWGVSHWTATMEKNKDSAHHLHLMLDFSQSVDRTARFFAFEDCCPNARANDLLGVGWSRSNQWQESVDRGHFYVWANKKGTVRDASGNLCVAANYEPAWTEAKEKYAVKAEWPEKLWKGYKLDDCVYFNEYLFLCKDKVAAKKRNFEAYRTWRKAQELDREVEQRAARIKGNPSLYQPFGRVGLAEEFLELFQQEAMRYPVLVVHAPSYAGKSEWAVSLFKRPLYLEIGAQGLWPPGMKQLDRAIHDGLVLDDLRDLVFLHENQEKLQGKYNRPVTLFNTPGGELACVVDLYRLPIVFTVNNSTKNLDYLLTHDFCKKRENVRLLCFRGRPGQSLVTQTLPEDGEEEGAWGRFVSEVGDEANEEQVAWDPYM